MKLLFTILPEQKGLRLDQVVAANSDGVSRSRAAALAAAGKIRVNDACKRPGYKVKTGDRVAGVILEEQAMPAPEKMDLNILHEDPQIMVLDKPAGQVVHPAAGHMSGTLVNGLLAHDAAFRDGEWDPLRPGIVHRLDKDTSGLILVAKNQRSLEFLQKEFKQRRVAKEYLALVQGDKIPEAGDIELPIGRHPKHRKMMAVLEAGGKYARTGFRVCQRFKGGALVAIRLYTGRTHQIRVHFYHQGMPLFGERTYQVRRRRNRTGPALRQMLHSWRLSFRHPYSGQTMAFESPMPRDFEQTLSRLSTAGLTQE
ncbi:MAG: RluA family pseudouridine synthase [Desulfobacter sp.]|nr:MAG: RluA family pseudouridine synthase [Desulfobacter sp.]